MPRGSPVIVDVYAAADEVELLLNGHSLGVAPVGATVDEGGRASIARFETHYAPGHLVAIARRAGREIGRSALRSLQGDLAVRIRAERDRVTATAADLAFVHIELCDDFGTLAVESMERLSVDVAGPGVLIALSSAKPDDEEGFGGNVHQIFEGRLLAVICPTGAGEIGVQVESETYGRAEITVKAESCRETAIGGTPR